MRIDTKKLKRLLLLNFPYIFVGLIATNLGEGWRLAEGANSSEKLLSFMTTLPVALQNPLPSFHPLDLLIGLGCGAALRLAVYLKGKNAKKYRHNTEYGSARWGTHKDIEPFMDENPENNIILTKTEGLTMSSRPKNPANARNKNVLIVNSLRFEAELTSMYLENLSGILRRHRSKRGYCSLLRSLFEEAGLLRKDL